MNWTVAVESHVDSSFFWGYLVTQIPGGFIASKFPANKIFGMSIVSSATFHLFVPFAMTLAHGHVVICVRVLQGLFEVSTYMHHTFECEKHNSPFINEIFCKMNENAKIRFGFKHTVYKAKQKKIKIHHK